MLLDIYNQTGWTPFSLRRTLTLYEVNKISLPFTDHKSMDFFFLLMAWLGFLTLSFDFRSVFSWGGIANSREKFIDLEIIKAIKTWLLFFSASLHCPSLYLFTRSPRCLVSCVSEPSKRRGSFSEEVNLWSPTILFKLQLGCIWQ